MRTVRFVAHQISCTSNHSKAYISYPLSHAFQRRKDGRPGPGQLFNNTTQQWESPSLREKEIFLGYDVGHTDGGPSVSDADRHHMLGQTIDRHVIQWFGAILAFHSIP